MIGKTCDSPDVDSLSGTGTKTRAGQKEKKKSEIRVINPNLKTKRE
jgi:hypothetical protein